MLSATAKQVLTVLSRVSPIDGQDIQSQTGLGEVAIKAAAVELRTEGLITTSGAPDMNEDSGMAIDRLAITPLGRLEARRQQSA